MSSTTPPLLALEAVTHVRQRQTVLSDFTYTFAAGQVYAVIGPNGAGKTSLLRLLALLENPTQGMVQWQGEDARLASDPLSLRRQIGFVQQHPLLFTGSVRANLACPLKFRGLPRARLQAQVDAALSEFHLTGLARRPAARLSGGETQRVALARVMAFNPSLLLLDEPTASLDPRNTQEFEDLLGDLQLRRNLTVILVTHDLGQAARLSQELLFLNAGRLIEAGPTHQVLRQPRDDRTRRFLTRDLLL